MDRDRLRAQLIRHEGLRLRPYEDSVGKITIGCGRNIEDAGISRQEADVLLDNDIDACINDLITFPWFVALDPVRQCALVDMRFNLGGQGFRKFVRMIHALEHGEYTRAAEHMLASKWAVQVKGRARRLAHMVKTGIDGTER